MWILMLLIIALVVFVVFDMIPYLVEQSRVSTIHEAKNIANKYPQGIRKVIDSYSSASISFRQAQKIIEEEASIASAQRVYDTEIMKETERKKREQFRKKVNLIRTQCPNACLGLSDDYIVENEKQIRLKQNEIRIAEAKSIFENNNNGVFAVNSKYSIFKIFWMGTWSDDMTDAILKYKDEIIAEQQRIAENRAEVERLMPEYSKLYGKYPLAVRSIVEKNRPRNSRERFLIPDNADDIKYLLQLSSSYLIKKQKQEENNIINDKERLNELIRNEIQNIDEDKKYYNRFDDPNVQKKLLKCKDFNKHFELKKKCICSRYGDVVGSMICESIDAHYRFISVSSFLDSIKREQDGFAQKTKSWIIEMLPSWGYYSYHFNNEYRDQYGHSKSIEMTVWQSFHDCCCFDDSVSYEYYPNYKNNRVFKTQLEGSYSYIEKDWDDVMSLLGKIKEKYTNELYVIFANTDNLTIETQNNNFRLIKSKLSNANIQYGTGYPVNIPKTSSLKIVVIDIITKNSNLVKCCESIFKSRYDEETNLYYGLTGILYITMLKCFDGAEVEELNQKIIRKNQEEQRRAKEEEERKEREAAQKKKDADDITNAKKIALLHSVGFKHYFPEQSMYSMSAQDARSIIQMASSICCYESMLLRIRDDVSGWKTVAGIPYYFFYYYYPTRFMTVSEDSQRARMLIYDFKDGKAHNTVKKLVIDKLRSTFSESDLSHMTFVCIPASTREANQSRYENFSNEICQALNMYNGYEHIVIVKEKSPSHLGGTDGAEYSFDGCFFKGKLVVLFDDIVTRGHSVSSMKYELELRGATIICALSIGRTFSDWNDQTPQPHPYTGRI